MQHTIPALEALLDQGARSWLEVLRRLDTWPPEASMEEALDAASSVISRWPLWSCPVPPSWLADEEEHPSLEIARDLDLSGAEEALIEKAAEDRRLLCIVNVKLTGSVRPAVLEALLASPRLRDIRCLHVESCNLQNHVDVVAEAAAFEDLETLVVGSCGLTDDGLRTLVQGARLPALRELHLWRNDIRDAKPLLELDALPQLTRLDLSENHRLRAGLAEVVAACSELRWLDLSHCDLTDEELEGIIRSQSWLGLEQVFLQGNALERASLLLEAPVPPGLEHLDVSDNAFSPEDMEALSAQLGAHRP